MSESDTRNLIERGLAAFNAGDHEGLSASLSEDVAVDVPGEGREIGREKARWRLAALARHFRAEVTDIAVMTAPGGLRAASEFTLRGTYLAALEGFAPANGQAFRLPAGLFFDIDDEGLISRVTVSYDRSRLASELESG